MAVVETHASRAYREVVRLQVDDTVTILDNSNSIGHVMAFQGKLSGYRCLLNQIKFSSPLFSQIKSLTMLIPPNRDSQTCLTIDGFGPISDNAGGIAEMAHLAPEVRTKTDALDSAGNTTAAIGKGFAIGSAALVSLALMSAFVTRVRYREALLEGHHDTLKPEILQPMTFAFMLFGACLPYWFSAMTMRSVGDAAMQMIREVERQFAADPSLLDEDSTSRPDYARCVAISTRASLAEMIAPGALVILSPLLVGTFFGVYAVVAMLTGSLLCAAQLAISMSNCGGAWDNAKKYVAASDASSALGGKGSEVYRAAVVCDTVGDPMKLMAIISLVFAEFFFAINDGRGLLKLPVN